MKFRDTPSIGKRDFLKKVENFKTTETPEEIKEVNRRVRESLEKSRKLGYNV